MTAISRWLARALAAFAMLLAVSGVAEAQDRRIALLIGNSAYGASVGPLKNPGNDIAGIRAALINAGFKAGDVQVVANATRLDIKREIDTFAARAAKLTASDIAFFYYSGHGAWRPGSRGMSLIPVDAMDATTNDFWYSTVSLDDEVLRAFHGSRSLAAWIVAIDACRNELRLPTRALGGGGDKAFQALPSQAGMLISFAADEGQTARDLSQGEPYSPYAASLIEALGKPGLNASSLFSSLRSSVMRRTGGAQQPVLTNKLNLDPVLNRRAGTVPPLPPVVLEPPVNPALPAAIRPSRQGNIALLAPQVNRSVDKARAAQAQARQIELKARENARKGQAAARRATTGADDTTTMEQDGTRVMGDNPFLKSPAYGVILMPGGMKYEGQINARLMPDGEGVVTNGPGSPVAEFVSRFKEAIAQGHVVVRFANGGTWEGEYNTRGEIVHGVSVEPSEVYEGQARFASAGQPGSAARDGLGANWSLTGSLLAAGRFRNNDLVEAIRK